MKKVLYVLIVCIMCFMCVNAKALPDKLTLSKENYVNPNGEIAPNGFKFMYKYSNINGTNYLVFCTENPGASADFNANGYTKDTNQWSNSIGAGVASIIKGGLGENITTTKLPYNSSNQSTMETLYATQIALWKYLSESLYNNDPNIINQQELTNSLSSLHDNNLNLYMLVYNLYNLAAPVATKAEKITNFSPTLDSSEINFTKQGDNYVSEPIKVNGDYIATINATATYGASVSGDNTNGYIVTVPSNSVTSESMDINVSFLVTSETQEIAKNYSPSNSTYQTITLPIFDSIQNSKTLTIQGNISTVPQIILEKVDKDGNHLDGAIFKITKNGQEFKNIQITNGRYVLKGNLDLDVEYCVEEIVAPEGYSKSSIKPCVTLTSSRPNASIRLTNNKLNFELSILKVDQSGKGLMGATLKLVDGNENVVKVCKNLQNDLTDCIWETTTSAYKIENLQAGTYYLYEESAPKGYDLLLNPIVIVVSNNGKITANGKTVSDGLIKVSNSLTRTKINKLGAIEGEQLKGAILQILNSEGKEMSCTLIDDQGNVSNNDKCMWNTGKEPKIILGLEKGKYYLTELSAPEGYELNKNKIEFEIKADGQTTEVTIKNNLSVEVPDTLSSRSTLLLTVGTLLIFIGTSIITQILKRTKKEF